MSSSTSVISTISVLNSTSNSFAVNQVEEKDGVVTHINKIPENFYIKVAYEKVVSGETTNHELNYKIKYDDINKKGLYTGWNDGRYLVVPKATKLTSTFQECTYYIDEANIQMAKYTPENLNHNQFGIDLIWQDAEFKSYNGDGKVYINYVKCIVEYDVPNYQVSITNPVAEAYKSFKYVVDYDGTESHPYYISCDNDFPLTVRCTNKSKAKGSNQTVTVDVPWGTDVIEDIYKKITPELISRLALCSTYGRTLAYWSMMGEYYEKAIAYVKEKGVLVVGITDFAPMDYKDENGEWIGFDADMARLVAEKLGVACEFVVIEWDAKIMELDSKAIDVVWNGMTLNESVLEAMNCTNPYCNNAQVIVLPAAE